MPPVEPVGKAVFGDVEDALPLVRAPPTRKSESLAFATLLTERGAASLEVHSFLLANGNALPLI